jgi:FkbM family methyltransferase
MHEHHISRIVLPELLKDRNIRIIDCGCRGGSFGDFDSLAGHLTVHGFDPDETECNKLNETAKSAGFDHHYHPYALARCNEKGRTFYITNEASSSSLLKPNERLIKRYRQTIHGNAICTLDTVGINRVVNTDTVSLDAWSQENGIADFDFIKLDVQGAELEILAGAESILSNVLGANIEVWFEPVYHGLPLFSDIDAFMRDHSFSFFSMHVYATNQYAGRMASPIMLDRMNSWWEQRMAGQLITADAIYLRDPLSVKMPFDVTIEKLLKLACIAEICGQIEFAFEILDHVKNAHDQGSRIHEANSLADVIGRAKGFYETRRKIMYRANMLGNNPIIKAFFNNKVVRKSLENSLVRKGYVALRKKVFGW